MDDATLLQELREQPERGVSHAIALYGGAVRTIVRGFLNGYSEADIEEAISDVFVKLWRCAADFQTDRQSSVKSYVYEIARNTAIDARRRTARQHIELELFDTVSDERILVEDNADTAAVNTLVREVVDALQEPDRSIFILRFYYAQPVRAVAEKLHLTEKSVEHRLARGKEKLKQKLKERGILYA